MGDDGKIEACDVVAFYDWNATSAGEGTDQIFLQWSSEYFTCKSDFVACSYVKNYCSGQKEYYQQRAQTDQTFLGGVGWYLELTDPDISPKGRRVCDTNGKQRDGRGVESDVQSK